MTVKNLLRQLLPPEIKDRYIEFKEANLLYISTMILESFYRDELILVVIHGKQGYGKSTYASIVLAQIYGYVDLVKDNIDYNPEEQIFKYNWDKIKKYFVFQPRDFIKVSRDQKIKSPCCVVDDAGLWLNAMDYNSPLVKKVGKFLEVARTKWGAILFTCSDQKQIFTKIRNMPHVYTVRIGKQGAGTKKHKSRRVAKIFEGWESEDLKKSGRKTKNIDVYYAEMPPHFYRWYKPLRDQLSDKGLDEIDLALDE